MSVKVTFPKGREPFFRINEQILDELARCLCYIIRESDDLEEAEATFLGRGTPHPDKPPAEAESSMLWQSLEEVERRLWRARAMGMYLTLARAHGGEVASVPDPEEP